MEAVSRELMVLAYHRLDLAHPDRPVRAHEVLVGQSDRRIQVIERARRPDAEVVKCGSNGEPLARLGIVGGGHSKAESRHAVHVVSIACEIATQRRRMLFQHRVESGAFLEVVFQARRFTQAWGNRLSIQARMSAITTSLPTSLSRSW